MPPKYPIEVEQEVAQISSPSKDADAANGVLPFAASRRKRVRKSKAAVKKAIGPQKLDEKAAEAQELTTHLNGELIRSTSEGIAKGDWGKVVKAAKSPLNAGIPLEDLKAAVSWGVDDRYWSGRLSGEPYRCLRGVLGAWRNRDKVLVRYGKSRPAPTAQPEFDERGPWAGTN
ncbi:MAG: hypothetical protein ACYC5Y_16030 [Symbiobacteriia bacterium]